VLEEPVVLGCENRLDDTVRYLLVRDGRALTLAELGQ